MARTRKRYIISADQMKAFTTIKEMLSLDHIVNNTTIFKERINGSALDESTVNAIKETFTLWHNSWIQPNLDKL